ncbi:sensor histidine kinase [Flavobacterium sp. 245]|uniref:sensor histidine kinase n=1 Tax=Flavobacterium sp. 245 TaxID=2512115 RepID=UPI001414CF4B|nr:sensor histidine kinase [Flavobacterium sp. 245]
MKAIPVRDEFNTYLINSQPFIDVEGFVWYAVNTEGTFFKYDGRNQIKCAFINTNEKLLSISSGSINSWIQDANNNIWAINLIGAYIINPKTLKVKHINWESKRSINKESGYVSSLLDKKKNVWISGGENYIIKFDEKYNQKIYYSPTLPNEIKYEKKNNEIINAENASLKIIKEIGHGKILVQSSWNIYLIDDQGMHFVLHLKDDNPNLHFIDNGRFFKKNTSGIILFDGKKYKYNYLKKFDLQVFDCPFDNFIYTKSNFFAVRDNKIYISVINTERSAFKTIDSIILKRNVLNKHLQLDHKGIIWFSTNVNIIMFKAADTRFKKKLQFQNSQISTRGIISDKSANLYVCSYSGLFKLNETEKFTSNIRDPSYTRTIYNSMLIDNDSILWVIGEGTFVKSINLRTNLIKTWEFNNKWNFQSVILKRKSKDSFWIGSNKGVFIFNKKTGKLFKYRMDDVNSDDLIVYDILQTRKGSLWIATNKGLYFKKKGSRFLDYKVKNPFFNNRIIFVLHEDKNENLWIGTNNSGVAFLNLKTRKLRIFDQSSGLSNNTVCGILESDEQLWFSTFYGLSVLNKKSIKFNNYYVQDGLSDNEFNLRSFYKKSDYSFYFGGLNGIVEVNPKNFNFSKKNTRIFISKTEYFSERLGVNIIEFSNYSTDIQLPYDKNYFSAEFAINDLYNQERSTYYYRIEGLTDGWVNVGGTGVIKLYNLPAGKFILEVKAKDFYGSETVNQIKINIVVEQIFFKTPYFIGFIILILGAFIVYEFKRKTKKQKRVFEREKVIIVLKANALKAQMNPHFVFNILNNMQSIMILKGEAEANKYFGAFSRLLRLTLDMSKQELVSLKDELEYINYYLILNNLQLNGELNFSIQAETIENKENIFIPGMLIQPFVENAIIHGLVPKLTGDKILQINCFVESHFLIVRIEDNGIGRSAAEKQSKKREFDYKSWSTTIVKERIGIINDSSKIEKVILKIEDLKFEEQCLGTIVIIKFKIR